MTDTELKIIVALSGIVAAVIGAVVSAVVFLWLEGRRHFQRQLAGLRAIVLMAESIYALLKSGHLGVGEVKLDWLTQYVDVILKDKLAYEILCKILQLRADVLGFRPDGKVTLFTLTQRADDVRKECGAMLDAHVTKLGRRVFLLSR
jgi:hypothetical protein